MRGESASQAVLLLLISSILFRRGRLRRRFLSFRHPLLVLKPVIAPRIAHLRHRHSQKLTKRFPASSHWQLEKLPLRVPFPGGLTLGHGDLCRLARPLVVLAKETPPVGRQVVAPAVCVVLSPQSGERAGVIGGLVDVVVPEGRGHGRQPGVGGASRQDYGGFRVGGDQLFGEDGCWVVRYGLCYPERGDVVGNPQL